LSKNSTSLLHWFKQRRNKMILTSLDSHNEKILDTLYSSIKLIDYIKKETSFEKVEKLYNRVSIQERSADHIQDELANEIAKGMLPPEIREKLFRLIRVSDSTANWAKTSSKNLLMLIKLKVDTTSFESILEYLTELLLLTIDSMKTFRKMCMMLGEDDQGILDSRQIVEDREREADEIHSKVRGEILEIAEELGFSIHYLFLDTAKSLENSSDSVSHAADVLTTIVMLGTPY